MKAPVRIERAAWNS